MANTSMPSALPRIGFWSAVITGGLALAWPVTLAIQWSVSPPAPWGGIEAYARSFSLLQMLNLVPSLPLAAAFVVMMVSLHYYVPDEKKIWTMVGLMFAVIYAVMASINYLIQFIVVAPALLEGQTEGLALFAGANPNSLFLALANAYAYQSLGLLFAAWGLGQTGLEKWTRWLFVAVGVTTPLQFAGTLGLLPMAVTAAAGLVWSLGVPAAAFLLAVIFKRLPRQDAASTITPGGPAFTPAASSPRVKA
jgi:hypothetical protein